MPQLRTAIPIGICVLVQLCCSNRVQWHFCQFRARWFSISIMNFENTLLRGDLWIKNVNYSLGIFVQSFARTKTVYALFYALSVSGDLSAIRARADTCQLSQHVEFSHESRFEIAMTNCHCDIWITECRHTRRERRLLRVCGLAFQSGEKKRGSFKCDLLTKPDCYFISIRKCSLSVEVAKRSCSSASQITI